MSHKNVTVKIERFTKKSENQQIVSCERPIKYTCCVILKLIGVKVFEILHRIEKVSDGMTDRETDGQSRSL